MKKMKEKKKRKTIAQRRIEKLFKLAEQNAEINRLDLANRYIEIARKISMRYLLPISNEYKQSYCKHCYSYLKPSINCRIRIHNKRIIIYCNNCRKFTRRPYKN